jgi:hypothetical protein
MILLTANSKDFFFDRVKVEAMIDKTEAIAFKRIGGRIRLTAMRSMRSQKKPKSISWDNYSGTPSSPGQPPKRRVPMGSGLSKIYFVYSPSEHQVQIAPVKFNWSAFPDATVPEVHEAGLTVKIVEIDYSFHKSGWQMRSEPNWRAARPRAQSKRGQRPMRSRTVSFPKRPFMFPALEKNLQFIRDSWAGASVSVGS